MKSKIKNQKSKILKFLSCIFGILFFIFSFGNQVEAATLIVVPERQRLAVGETVSFKVGLDAQREAVNVVDVRLLIPEGLEGIRVDTAASPVQFWIEAPRLDPSARVVTGVGGIAGGGLTSKTVLFNLTLRAKTAGVFEVKPDASSRLYLADGQGTEQVPTLQGASITVLGETGQATAITSPTHPDENQWYKLKRAEVLWQTYPDRVYSFSVDRDPTGLPDDVPDNVTHPVILENLADGIHFVHVREGRLASEGLTWVETSHFRVMVDGTPPEPFEAVVGSAADAFGGEPFVAFATTDKTSGVWYYSVYERPRLGIFTESVAGNEGVRTDKTSHPLARRQLFQIFGGEILVSAYDQAENVREVRFAIGRTPWILESGVAIPVGVILLIWIIKRVARLALWRKSITPSP